MGEDGSTVLLDGGWGVGRETGEDEEGSEDFGEGREFGDLEFLLSTINTELGEAFGGGEEVEETTVGVLRGDLEEGSDVVVERIARENIGEGDVRGTRGSTGEAGGKSEGRREGREEGGILGRNLGGEGGEEIDATSAEGGSSEEDRGFGGVDALVRTEDGVEALREDTEGLEESNGRSERVGGREVLGEGRLGR